MSVLYDRQVEKRLDVDGRTVIAKLVEANGRWYVDRLSQVVVRPRAYTKVKRRLWPAAKPNAVALAALARLEASATSGITPDGWSPFDRAHGGAA